MAFSMHPPGDGGGGGGGVQPRQLLPLLQLLPQLLQFSVSVRDKNQYCCMMYYIILIDTLKDLPGNMENALSVSSLDSAGLFQESSSLLNSILYLLPLNLNDFSSILFLCHQRLIEFQKFNEI